MKRKRTGKGLEERLLNLPNDHISKCCEVTMPFILN